MAGNDAHFLNLAISQALEGGRSRHGGPFGAVIVKDGEIIVQAHNRVLIENDPTAHAEVVAIRMACRHLNHYQLTDCIIYASCEPCPMCLGAIYWARPTKLVFCATRLDAGLAGFDDSMIYDQLVLPHDQKLIETIHLPLPEWNQPFEWWASHGIKSLY